MTTITEPAELAKLPIGTKLLNVHGEVFEIMSVDGTRYYHGLDGRSTTGHVQAHDRWGMGSPLIVIWWPL